MTLSESRLCGIGDEASLRPSDQLEILSGLGLNGLEVRSLGGRHLHELSLDEVRQFGAELADRQLVVPVVDTPIGNWERTARADLPSELRLLIDYAERSQILGSRCLRIMSYANCGLPDDEWKRESLRRVRALARLASALDVVLLHENCAGWAGQSSEATLQLLDVCDGENIALVFDTGNGAAYGYDSLEFLREVANRVQHVHLKDAVVQGGEAQFVVPGDGECGVSACLERLQQVPHELWVSVEPHVAHLPHVGTSATDAVLEDAYTRCAQAMRVLVRGAMGVDDDR